MSDVGDPVTKCGQEPYCDECMFVALNGLVHAKQMQEFYQREQAQRAASLLIEGSPVLGKLKQTPPESTQAQDAARATGDVAAETDPYTGEITKQWGHVPAYVSERYPGCVFLVQLATMYHEVHHSANAARNRILHGLGTPNLSTDQRNNPGLLGSSFVGSYADTQAQAVQQDTIADEIRAYTTELNFWNDFYQRCLGKTTRKYPPLDPFNQSYHQMLDTLSKSGFGAA